MTQVHTSVSFLIFYQQCINFFILLDLRCTHILHTPFLPVDFLKILHRHLRIHRVKHQVIYIHGFCRSLTINLSLL